MRISDWSSDVCSSDLPQAVISTRNQTVMPVTTSTADLRDGDKTVMAQRVIVLLDRLSRLTRELQFVDGLNPAQWEALRFLATANKYSRPPPALAEYLGATKGTVSQNLIAPESKGLRTASSEA